MLALISARASTRGSKEYTLTHVVAKPHPAATPTVARTGVATKGEIVKYLTARYMERHTLKARMGAPHLPALRTSSAWTIRSKNLAMSQSPVTTHFPSAAAASALTALR